MNSRAVYLLATLGWAAGLGSQSPPARGPIEVREAFLPAQPRLTLGAATPLLLATGVIELRLQLETGNDFGWEQDRRAGEFPAVRHFLVDGEHRLAALELRRGLSSRFEGSLRLPLLWRGGGFMDGVIDGFHGFTRQLGLPENGRPSFDVDRLRIAGADLRGAPLEWTGRAGTGLGALELSGRWACAGPTSAWPATLRITLALPTHTGPFVSAGIEGAGQLQVAHALGRRTDLYLGLGASVHPRRQVEGLSYTLVRPQGYAAFEWRPWSRVSLLVQLEGAGRLLDDVDQYPRLQSYLRLGAKLAVGQHTGLELGFSENIKNQQATTDFGVFLGLMRSF